MTDQLTPKYPDITVQLTGCDGNAFALIGQVTQALRRAGVGDGEISDFRNQAISGDYNNVLTTCMAWVDVE